MSIATLIFGRPAPTPIRPSPDAGTAGARAFRGGVSYAAALGERVDIEVRSLRGRLVFRSSRTHAEPGLHRFTWPSPGAGACVARLTYSPSGPGSGRVHRILLLPSGP